MSSLDLYDLSNGQWSANDAHHDESSPWLSVYLLAATRNQLGPPLAAAANIVDENKLRALRQRLAGVIQGGRRVGFKERLAAALL